MNIKKISSYLIKILIITIFIILSTMQFVAESVKLVDNEYYSIPEGISVDGSAFYPPHNWDGTRGLGKDETVDKTVWDGGASGILCDDEGIKIGYNPAEYHAVGSSEGNAFTAFIHAHSDIYGSNFVNTECARITQIAWWQFRFRGVEMDNSAWNITKNLLNEESRVDNRPKNDDKIKAGYKPQGELTNETLIDGALNSIEDGLSDPLKSKIINECFVFDDENDKKPSELYENVRKLFNDGEIDEDKYNQITYLINKGFDSVAKEAINKNFNEETGEYDKEDSSDDSDDSDDEKYKYSSSFVGADDLYSWAKEFYTYTKLFLDGTELKDEYKPKVVTKKADGLSEDTKISFDKQTQCYIMGPIKIIYPYYEYNNKLFAGITDVKLSYTNTDDKIIEVDRTTKDIDGLEAGQWNFLLTKPENVPESGDEVYIALKYSEDIKSISNMNIKAKYMSYFSAGWTEWEGTEQVTVETSRKYKFTDPYYKKDYKEDGKYDDYDGKGPYDWVSKDRDVTVEPGEPFPYDKYPNAIVNSVEVVTKNYSKTTQPLTTPHENRIFFNEKEASTDFPTPMDDLVLTKKAVDEDGNVIESDDEFNFQVWIEDDGISDHKIVEDFDGTTYYLWRNNVVVQANKTTTVDMPYYYPENYGGKKPRVVIVETDSMGIKYTLYKEIKDLLDKEDAKVLKEALRNLGIDAIKPDSIWLSGGYIVPDKIDGLGTGVTYKGDGVYYLDGNNLEVTAVNIKEQKHGHLSITKKMRKEYYTQDEVFNMSLDLTVDGENTTANIPLRIQKDPYSEGYKITLKDGTVVNGIIEGSSDDNYYYATWTSGEIKWNSGNLPTYYVEEKLEGDQIDKYTPIDISNASGYISECNQKHSSDILSGDYKVEPVEVEIENVSDSTITTEVEKQVVDQDGNPNEIEIDKDYLVDITYTGDIDGERVELGDSSTVEISPKGKVGKYSISKRPEVEQYYVRIDEHENTDGSFWKDFEAVYANGDKEEPISEEDIEIVYEKDQYGTDTEKIDYIEIKINSEKINSFKIKFKVKNTMSFTGLTLKKSCPDFEALKKLGINTFYFKIEPVSINYFKRPFGLDVSFYETYKNLFNDDRYLKDENGNLYKDKVIVKVTEDDGFVLNSNVIPFTSIPLQITEVDQFGVAYSDFALNSYDSEEDYQNSIWNICYPTDGEGYNFYRFNQYAKESDIPFGTDAVTAVFANKGGPIGERLRIKKKLSSHNGNVNVEEFFEENPNFEFRFKVFAEINFDYYDMTHIHSDGDGMENYEDITNEYFGGYEVVINRSNYESGVTSKNIPKNKYTGKFIVKELLDNGESGLFRPNGNNTYDTWIIDSNTVTVESEDLIPTVEVEAENFVGRIQLDKSIEPFEDGEEFYFRMFENGKDVTEKYFGVSKVTITKAIHDQDGIISSDVYGNHEFTIVEYDDKDYKYEDRADSDSDYWNLFTPDNNGTWTFTMSGEDLNEDAIRLIEAKNYKDRRIQVRKTVSDSSDEDKTYYFDVYVKGEDIKYGTESDGVINSTDIKDELKDAEGYQKLTTLQATVKAGETTSEWVSTDYIRFSGDKISYKVIEVDENGVSYSEYNSDPSAYTGTFWNSGVIPNNDGVWSGTLNKEITKREGEIEKVEAVNSEKEPIWISLSKSVLNKNNKIEPIADGEKFIYNIDVTGYGTERVEITKENPTWRKAYFVEKGETLIVTATEVDDQGRTYENRGDSEFWKEFVPADGKGIITKEVKFDGSSLDIKLEGTNIKKSQGKLKIIKEKKPFVDGERFYFTINNLSQEELANMFSSAETATVGGKGAIVLTYNNPIAISNDIDWISDFAPKYTITEVDENGNAYGDLTEEQRKDSAIWSVCNPEDGGVHTITLQSDSESPATVSTCIQVNNSEKYSFTIKKEVKSASLDITDESIVENHKEFYFKVIDIKNNKTLNEEELKDILEDKYATYVKTLSNGIAVVTLNENNYSEGVISKKIDKSLQYKIVEVDDNGDEYSETSASEYWKEFTPERTEWIASEKNPTVTAINYSSDNYWAQVNVSKIFNGNWKDGDYEILVQISTDGGNSWDTLKSFTFNPNDYSGKYVTGNPDEIDSDNYDARLTWKQGDVAPKIRFRETTDTGKKVTYRINDETVEENTEYQLSDGKGMQCSLECTNGGSNPDRHYGNILVKKSLDYNANISFTFNYQYKKDGEDWGPVKTLIVPANGVASTEVISWDDGEENPEFRIWEVEDFDYTLKSISIVNADKVENAQKYNSNGVQGKLNCTKHKTENQPQVEVSAENSGSGHRGGLKILKKFNVIEEKGGVTVEDIMKDLKAISPDYEFKFIVNIYNDNNIGSFNYKGVEYSNDNVARVEMSVSIDELLSAMSSSGKSTSEVQIGDVIEVSWKGDKAPKFEVEEENSGKFWHGTIVDGSSTQFVEGKTIDVLFVNEYTVTIDMGLYTKLAGLVWEDSYNKDKDGTTAGIDADGVYELGEKLVDNVYVVPVRVLSDGETEIRARNSDSTYGGFIKNGGKDYYYISNSDNGRWHFEDVEVPAKRSGEESFEDIYYDIEFYYDGTLYEPTEFLAELGGVAEAYKSLQTGEKAEYFDNSFAIESSDGKDRKKYNAQFATVTGDQPFNGAVDPDTVSTVGKVLDSNGNEKSYVDYKTVAIAGSGDNEVLRYISNGTLRSLSPDNPESEDYINNNLFMKATTENAGLTYFFGYDFALTEDMLRIVEKDSVHYYYGINVLDIDYAEHINLGLKKRQRAELMVDKTIDSATIIVNDKYKTYYLNNNASTRDSLSAIIKDLTKDLNNKDVFGNLQDYINNDEVKSDLNIYQSDYNYRVAAYQGTPVATALDRFYQAINGGVENDAIKSKELKVFLTYKVKIKNASGDYDVKVKYLDDYYSSDLTYVDVASGYNYMGGTIKDGNNNRDGHGDQPGLWAYIEQDQKEETNLTNLFASEENYYKNSITSDNIKRLETISTNVGTSYNKDRIDLNKDDKHGVQIGSGKQKTYYLTYKVGNVNQFLADARGILFELGEKRNYAEVQEFTPYISGTKYKDYAGVLDRYSAPGSLNMQDYSTYMEQDTDFAIVDLMSNPDANPRTISGTAWLDSESEEFNNQIIGNGRIDGENDKPLEGYTARLVQVIDVPTVDDTTGKITDNYEEYEFYWDNANSVTDANGKYTINGYTSNGIVNKGLMPGNFIVRFNYGDEYNEAGINGEDYKTTIYQVDGNLKATGGAEYVNNEWIAEKDTDGYDIFSIPENNNQFRDNEARRLKIIKDTYELDNDKTATFNVAGQTRETYVDNMKADYDKQINDGKYPDYAKQYDEFTNKLYQPLEIQQNGDYAYDNGRLTKANGYAMFADTAKMNLPVENPNLEAKSADDLNAQTEGYEIASVNFGLEERSKTDFYMDKQIEQIKLTTSSDNEFFNLDCDINYYYGETEEDIKNNNKIEDGYELYKVKDDIWVQIIPKAEVKGISNLQSLRDVLDEDNNETRKGFKYINTDSIVLQGLTMEIKYRFTVFNLSETDTYGEKLDEILYGENYLDSEKINNAFNSVIDKLSSPEYQIAPDNGHLNFLYEGNEDYSGPKSYGRYLGNTYYRGFNGETGNYSKWDTDKVVTTTVRQMIDYVDNDIGVSEIGATQGENGELWQIRENNIESLGDILDNNIFVDGKVYNELSTSNVPYNNILLTADSKEYNSNFVKRLIPKDSELDNNNHGDDIKDCTSSTSLTETKEFSATDKGDTGIDNYAEIVLVENTVGRRDVETVYGNYDPRSGAQFTTERDESSTEIITLSPPTGNEENEREMLSWMSVVIAIALVAGGTTGISIGIIKKSKKQKFDDEE